MELNQWIDHPSLKNMNKQKIQLIKTAAEMSEGKSGKELSNIMMALIVNAQKQGIHFSQEEFTCILSVLKEGKSEKEKLEIDHMIDFARSVMKKSML